MIFGITWQRRTRIILLSMSLKTIPMETLSYISRTDRYHRASAADRKSEFETYQPEERTGRFRKAAFLPFLVLLYIFNGCHDPKKVHRLNIMLSAVFFAGGLLVNSDFLLPGFMFAVIAVTNIVCVRIVQTFCRHTWSPAEGEIFSQVHTSVREYAKK